MIEISKDANPNYLAKVVRLGKLSKHPNADRLQTVDIDFQTVITGLDAKEGNYYIYFPVECKINEKFLAHINGFRNTDLNFDSEANPGFFEDNCRVKAIKLRGEKSMGFICPATELMSFASLSVGEMHELEGKEFDTLRGIKLLEKYVIPVKESNTNKTGKKPKASRLIDGQVHLHVDTENLRKNAHKIKPNDDISISYKTHGTSWWVSKVQVKLPLNWIDKTLKWFGVSIQETEYDIIYGSRKVVKNKHVEPDTQGHYFGYDLWNDIMQEVSEFIPKNYTLYGECTGFDKNGKYIQKDYDYGCADKQHKLEIYRITVTNPDGMVTELSTAEIIEFCNKTGLLTPLYFFYGKAKDLLPEKAYPEGDDVKFSEALVKHLEGKYLGRNCFMCNNTVPAEGIVLRKESLFGFNAYKLKSFDFLERETKQLDSGEVDMESQN